MLFDALAAASDDVGATSKRNEKVELLADVLRRLDLDEVEPACAFLVGATPLGRIGVGWATLADTTTVAAAAPLLTIGEVAAGIRHLDAMGGGGVVVERREYLRTLMGSMTLREQRLLRAILGGELRQGALDGVLTTAVARAGDVPVAAVRRAAMMAGNLAEAARAALGGGTAALAAVMLEPLRPVQPMLASPAADVAEAMSTGDLMQVDWKLDGARVQVHRRGEDVAVFTRNLNDVTEGLGGVVEMVRSFPGGDLVLDGEALGVLDDGSPQAFQDTMRRETRLEAFFFDILYVHGRPVHDEPLSVRRELLAEIVPEAGRLASILTDDAERAQQFLDDAIAAGHEGVMVKDLTLPYAAGRRGGGWLKVKPVYTFDLVVLAVEPGHGRRTGLLSNVHLGARDADSGEFVMVGKTFKGMTDEMLRWQTERFSELEVERTTVGGRHAVVVRPVQVVEVAIDGVQRSSTYPGGVALRFARVKRYRHDKDAIEADTIDALRTML